VKSNFSLDISELEENKPKDTWADVRIVKGGPSKNLWAKDTNGKKTGLGQVRLVLKWATAENAEVLLQQWTEEDLIENRIKVTDSTMRFRAPSPEVKYGWLQAIAWVERGGRGKQPPKIPAPSLCDQDLNRVANNPSTVDLPISACRHLLYNLRRFECLGLKA
jgi:hypothetical protein